MKYLINKQLRLHITFRESTSLLENKTSVLLRSEVAIALNMRPCISSSTDVLRNAKCVITIKSNE